MKTNEPNRDDGTNFPYPGLTYNFIVGTVERVEHYPPLPPGGTRLKFVRGKGLVVIGPIKPKKAKKEPKSNEPVDPPKSGKSTKSIKPNKPVRPVKPAKKRRKPSP